jgi:hypothetical protein
MNPVLRMFQAERAAPVAAPATDQATILRNLVAAGEEALDRMDRAGITDLCPEFVALKQAVLNAKKGAQL